MYKVTVEKITKIEYPEMQTLYRKGEKQSTSRYDLDPSNGRVDSEEQVPTGRKLQRIDRDEIYQQTLEKIDLSALVVLLNK